MSSSSCQTTQTGEQLFLDPFQHLSRRKHLPVTFGWVCGEHDAPLLTWGDTAVNESGEWRKFELLWLRFLLLLQHACVNKQDWKTTPLLKHHNLKSTRAREVFKSNWILSHRHMIFKSQHNTNTKLLRNVSLGFVGFCWVSLDPPPEFNLSADSRWISLRSYPMKQTMENPSFPSMASHLVIF